MECFKISFNVMERRLDPHFYRPEFKTLGETLKKSNYKTLGNIIDFANETWNQKDFFDTEFPYIEISEIDIITGEVRNITYYGKDEAPSRAKMIVRYNDIIVSTTRPSRGAIALIDKAKDGFIASTGFAILRDLKTKEIDRNYLFYSLRTNLLLNQMLQRSSGGNYPAITTDELKEVIVPLPTLEIQNRIVSIMQSAYEQKKQKEQEADKLLNSIDGYVLNELGIKLSETKEKKCFIAWSKEVNGQRIDPKKYSEKPKAILRAIKESRYKLKELSGIIVDNVSGEWGEEEITAQQKEDYSLCKVLRNTNFDNKLNLDFDDVAERFIPKEKFRKIGLKNGDILIEKSGGSPIQPVGRVALIEDIKSDYTFSNFLQCLRINKDECLPEYLFAYLKAIYSLNYTEYLQNQTTGIKNLIMEEYLATPIVLPSLEIQNTIAKEVKKRMTGAGKLKREVNDLIAKSKQQVEELILGKAK